MTHTNSPLAQFLPNGENSFFQQRAQSNTRVGKSINRVTNNQTETRTKSRQKGRRDASYFEKPSLVIPSNLVYGIQQRPPARNPSIVKGSKVTNMRILHEEPTLNDDLIVPQQQRFTTLQTDLNKREVMKLVFSNSNRLVNNDSNENITHINTLIQDQNITESNLKIGPSPKAIFVQNN